MLVLGLAVTAAPALTQDGGGASANGNGGTDASAPATSSQTTTSPSGNTGGAEYGSSTGAENTNATPVVDGFTARILADGTAAAPSMAPPEVQQGIWAANRIVGRPYVYGGGPNPTFPPRRHHRSGTAPYPPPCGGLHPAPPAARSL